MIIHTMDTGNYGAFIIEDQLVEIMPYYSNDEYEGINVKIYSMDERNKDNFPLVAGRGYLVYNNNFMFEDYDENYDGRIGFLETEVDISIPTDSIHMKVVVRYDINISMDLKKIGYDVIHKK